MGLRQDQSMAVDSALKRKYDLMKQQVSQQTEAAGQEQTNALQRRLASLGNLQSGAAIKQQQMLGEKVGQAKQQATQAVDIAQAGEEAQREAQRQQMEFAKGEREASQKFAAGERLASQQFAGGETQKQRDFQKQMYDQDSMFKNKVFETETDLKRQQLDMASQEMKDNKNITAFNAFASAMESGNPAAYQEALQRLGQQLGVDMNYGSLPGAPDNRSLGEKAAGAVGGNVIGSTIMGPVGSVVGTVGGWFGW